MDDLLPDVPYPSRSYQVTADLILPGGGQGEYLEAFTEAVQAVAARLGMAGADVTFTAPRLRVGITVEARSQGEAVLAGAGALQDIAAGWLAVDSAEAGSA